MFTGIVEETGRVSAFVQMGNAWKLHIAAKVVSSDVALGDSVSVNGCCLTVTQFDAENLWFDVLEETRRLTNFSQLAVGSKVNLERSVRADTRMGGHFVTGHVDLMGRVVVFEKRGNDFYLRVKAPGGFARYLVYKGCIAIDGISLTVAEVQGDEFAVWLIPHTLEVTNLQDKKAGDAVNLEFDLLAKYVEKLTAK
ncbi:riboflavin synthase [Oleiharenicola lentus]|uniref:riboflavin synthase n=1 Tax=Oleiharenicola lentus TaxID=2508720 RepID=UPI003F679A26